MESQIQCPHCMQWVEVAIEPEDRGSVIQDCDVCCRPLEIVIRRDKRGNLKLSLAGGE